MKDKKSKTIFIVTNALLAVIFTILLIIVRNSNNDKSSLPVRVEIRNSLQCFECIDYYHLAEELEVKYKDNPDVTIKYYNSDISQSYFDGYLAAMASGRQDKFWDYLEILYRTEQPYSEHMFQNIAVGIGLDLNKFNADRSDKVLISEANDNLKRSQKMGDGQDPLILINNKIYTDKEISTLESEINLLLEKAK